MVFESIVTDLLNKYLGEYVENLDSSQLNISIWGGDVVLNDLNLKQSALDELNLPVRTLYGHLGKLVLKIPWKNLYNAPVIVSIENLYLLAVPNQEIKYDPIKDEAWKQQSKQAELQKVEEAKKKEKKKVVTEEEKTFAEKLAAQIIKNIQLNIKNIHVRYEDRVSNPGLPFSLGVTLSSLVIHTIPNWGPTLKINPLNLIYKELSLDSLAVYLNPKGSLFLSSPSSTYLELFQSGIASKESNSTGYNYFVGPISANSKLRINIKPEVDGTNFTVPKFLVVFDLEQLAVRISKSQYQDVVALLSLVNMMSLASRYRKYRPNLRSYRGYYKQWWHFAYTCILEEIRRKKRDWDWNHMKAHRELCRKYGEAYYAKISSSKPSESVLQECTNFELILDTLNIILTRRKMELKLARSVKVEAKATTSKENQGGWFSKLWGSSSDSQPKEADASLKQQLQQAMTTEEKNKLFQAIGYQEGASVAVYPDTFIEFDVGLTFHSLELEILNDDFDEPRILMASLTKVVSVIQVRPNGLMALTSIDLFSVYGMKQGEIIPQFVFTQAKVKSFEPEQALLVVLFENNPLDGTCNQRVHVSTRPLVITYDAQTINNLVFVFETDDPVTKQLQAAVTLKLNDITQKSSAGLQYVASQHSKLDLKIEMMSSCLVIPESGFYRGKSTSVIVLNTGELKVNSVLTPRDAIASVEELQKKGVNEEEILKAMIEQCYDNFHCHINDLQALFAFSDEPWLGPKKSKEVYLLEPVNLDVTAGKSIIPDDPRIPGLKVKGLLPKIQFSVSDRRVKGVLELLLGIPLPETAPPVPEEQSSLAGSYWSVMSSTRLPKSAMPGISSVVDLSESSSENIAQFTTLDAVFVLKELAIDGYKESESKLLTPIFHFEMVHLEASLVQKTFNMVASIKLIGVAAQVFYKMKPMRFINTQETCLDCDYLISVIYTNVDKKSPEFHSRYGSTLQALEVEFTKLNVVAHLEGLLRVVEWANDITQVLSKPEEEVAPTKSLPTIDENTSLRGSANVLPYLQVGAADIKKRMQKKKARVEVIDLKLHLRIQEISLTLATKSSITCTVSFDGGWVKLIMKKSYTQLETSLKGFQIYDHQEGTSYKKILGFVDCTEALNAEVVMFNDPGKGADKMDIMIKLSMVALRFVFIQSFINNLMNFLNNFQKAQEKILEASHAVAEAAKLNVQDAYRNSVRVKLDVNLDAPIIVFPLNKRSVEAFFLDLGVIIIKNNFFEVPSVQELALLDKINLDMSNLKLSRVTLDESLAVTSEILLLEPITFRFGLQRNLSAGWYHDVPDVEIRGGIKTVSLRFSRNDYVKMLRMLDGNLGEPNPYAAKAAAMAQKAKAEAGHAHSPAVKEVAVLDPEGSTTNLKFAVTLDKLAVELFFSHPDEVATELGEGSLTSLALHLISLKGSVLSNGMIHTALLLMDCTVLDTRASQETKINRYMERKKVTEDNDSLGDSSDSPSKRTQSMIDITFQQKRSQNFANLCVSGFNLVLNVEYLMKVAAFFSTLGEIDETQKHAKDAPGRIQRAQKELEALQQESTAQEFSINLKLEYPDIILVESLEDANTNSLLLHAEISGKLRALGNRLSIDCSVNEFQILSCNYDPHLRKKTKFTVLKPVSFTMIGITPDEDCLHIDFASSDVRMFISPGTIELLTKVHQTTMSGGQEVKPLEICGATDLSDLWLPKTFHDTEFGFLKTELAVEASSDDIISVEDNKQAVKKREQCILSMPSIVIAIEAGVGSQTLPMILFETSVTATVNDWSSNLTLNGHLSLQVSYYNSILALWEPLVEPVEVVKDEKHFYIPWGLDISVDQAPVLDEGEASDSDQNSGKTMTRIGVYSKETMEITITKTCLDVLRQLGDAFTAAIQHSSTQIGKTQAQYVVRNETGLTLTVILEDSDFQVYDPSDDRRATAIHSYISVKQVVLESGASVDLSTIKDVDLGLHSEIKEKYLSIQAKEYSCNIKLSVVRADKRFFELDCSSETKDHYGIVSDIQVQNGCTTVTLRGIIQIVNHFKVPILVYYMTKKGNELLCVGKVEPEHHFNLPLEAIYTPTSELFFSVEGFSVSIVPFIWKDLQKTLGETKIMQCNPRNEEDKEPFFIKAIGEIEQIYFELTNRHTMFSSCYNIHLRPTVIFRNSLPVTILLCIQGVPTEKDLAAGHIMQLPTAEPGSSSLVMRITNYLDREWTCKYEIQSKFGELSIATFDSYESIENVQIHLGVHTILTHGSMLMDLYCPFWMINKTGYMLSYKSIDDQSRIIHHPPNLPDPIMFSFRAKSFFSKKKSSVRIEDGAWSDKFSLDVAGSSGFVTCTNRSITYQIGVSIQLSSNPLTKVVIFIPFFIISNNFSVPLEVQEVGRPSDAWIKVAENGCSAFWPVSKSNQGLRARVVGTKESTIAFPYDKIYSSLLKLTNKYGGINVQVQVNDGSTNILLHPYECGMAPALIINHASTAIDFYDKSKKDLVTTLEPKHNILFAWETTDSNRQFMFAGGHYYTNLIEDGIGEFVYKNEKYYWASFLFGLQRVLLFTDDFAIARDAENIEAVSAVNQELEISIHGIGLSLLNNVSRAEVLYLGITSSGVVWESKKGQKKRFKHLSFNDSTLIERYYIQYTHELHIGKTTSPIIDVEHRFQIDFAKMEMLKPSKRYLRRTYNTGLWIHITSSNYSIKLHAKLNKVQIDNQTFDCTFPVILCPVPPPKSLGAESGIRPFIEVSIVKQTNDYSTVEQYKYFKILIQEFHVKVDMGFINNLVNFFETGEESISSNEAEFQKSLELSSNELMFFVSLATSTEQKNFYEILHLSPLKIHVSFSMSSTSHQSALATESHVPSFFAVILQSVGVTLTDIHDVIFKLAFFERKYVFLSQKQLVDEIQSHYINQFIKQLYVLVFGLDVLGNPFGFVLDLKQGATDLFYEPYQGAIQGPGEFAEGLVLGFRSLLGHTVGGAAGAVSRITGAVGTGLAALTFDKDFQRKRREVINQAGGNVQEGLARSGKGLVMGVVEGVGGVITQPLSGARDEGVSGFFKGIGKGVVGLVTRPTAGIVDFASGSLSAVKRVADLSAEITRIRIPRPIKKDGLIRPYSKQEAEGNKLLHELDKGKYLATDTYIYHIPIGTGKTKDMLLLTDQRISYLSYNELFGNYQLEWAHKWPEVTGPPIIANNGVIIPLDKRKGLKSLFSTAESGKILLVDEMFARQHLVKIISAQLVQSTNNRPSQ